jgi:hypothetical protein
MIINRTEDIRRDLAFRGYYHHFIGSVIKKLVGNGRSSTDRTYFGMVIFPYIGGIFEKFQRIGNRFNIRTVFKTRHGFTLREPLLTSGPDRHIQDAKQCVYSAVCECYSRWERLSGNIDSLRSGVIEKSKLVQHSSTEYHHISFKEAKVLQMEQKTCAGNIRKRFM